MPLPPSELVEVFGEHLLARMIFETDSALRPNAVNRELIHYMDVRAFIDEEIHAAYEFLNRSSLAAGQPVFSQPVPAAVVADLWQTQLRGERLYEAIRYRNMRSVFDLRQRLSGDRGLRHRGPPRTS